MIAGMSGDAGNLIGWRSANCVLWLHLDQRGDPRVLNLNEE